jgi:hypothetical protein
MSSSFCRIDHCNKSINDLKKLKSTWTKNFSCDQIYYLRQGEGTKNPSKILFIKWKSMKTISIIFVAGIIAY